jgi:hypothetical protein
MGVDTTYLDDEEIKTLWPTPRAQGGAAVSDGDSADSGDSDSGDSGDSDSGDSGDSGDSDSGDSDSTDR